MIVAAARVSTRGTDSVDDLDKEANYGLINYLMKNKHGTPFEHSTMTVFVHAPIFVFREWHRHRIGISINEESGRYKQLEPVFYIPDELRPGLMQKPGGRPGQYEYINANPQELSDIQDNLALVYREAYRTYQNLLSFGAAKEVARMCLPVAIYSSMYWTCNPRSLMAFLSLRTKRPEWDWAGSPETNRDRAKFPSKPQYEINVASDALEEIFKEHWPLTYKAYNENGRVAP